MCCVVLPLSGSVPIVPGQVPDQFPQRTRQRIMPTDRSLHVEQWSGKPSQAEDAFLQTLAETARRDGSKLCRRLADEIERLSPTRRPWVPSSSPSVAHLPTCLANGPVKTNYLCGSIAAVKAELPWKRLPTNPSAGPFNRRHAFCEIVGEKSRIPSERLRIGLFLMDGKTHYPTHKHSADEIYLALSGTFLAHVGQSRPAVLEPGSFLRIPSATPHAFWTDKGSALLAWAWLGDLKGPYEFVT